MTRFQAGRSEIRGGTGPVLDLAGAAVAGRPAPLAPALALADRPGEMTRPEWLAVVDDRPARTARFVRRQPAAAISGAVS